MPCVLQAPIQGGNVNAVYAILMFSICTLLSVLRMAIWSFESVAELCWV